MTKRLFDFTASFLGLLVTAPILLPVMFLVWLQDKHSPFYVAPRVGKDEKIFQMVKLRSMVINADKSGVDSTSADDNRITPIGKFIRSYKLDELTQLWNVLKGDMSLVGPRPNVKRETDLYTPKEKKLLEVRPGITDFSSIVFSDEGEILAGKRDPDLAYNQLIRPHKSRLSLVYIQESSFLLDLELIGLTLLAAFNKEIVLERLCRKLNMMGVTDELLNVVRRKDPLVPTSPPGDGDVVSERRILCAPQGRHEN